MLRRMRIVNEGGDLIFAMLQYLETLRVRYHRILEEGSRASRTTTTLRLPLEGTEDLLHARSLSQRSERPARIEAVALEDGTTSSEPAGISRVFRGYFADSAPGPDGLLTGFYPEFFDVLGNLLTCLVNIFLQEGFEPRSFNKR